jgi:hypothetical protein
MHHPKSMGNPYNMLVMQVIYDVKFRNGCDDYQEV